MVAKNPSTCIFLFKQGIYIISKSDGWEMILFLQKHLFSGAFAIGFMEGRLWIVPTPSKLVSILLEVNFEICLSNHEVMILVRISVVTQKMETGSHGAQVTPPSLNEDGSKVPQVWM